MAVYMYGKFDRFKIEKILLEKLNFKAQDIHIQNIKNILYVSNYGDFRISLNYVYMGKIQIDGEGAVQISKNEKKSENYPFYSKLLKEIKPDGVLDGKLYYKTLNDLLLDEDK
jgi:hypothetical protein